MRVFAHIATIVIALAVIVGVPFALSVDVGRLLAGDVDTVSSASVIQDAPSGAYTILINEDKHPDTAKLDEWTTFFEGGDIGIIFEDLDCVALASDAAGIEMAESLQSRLPEHQMDLTIEDATMALSKAEYGLFDILVMSDEAASTYGASSLYDNHGVRVVRR